MVKLCTFGQMANCLERGGAAYRFGRQFPIYFNGGKLYEYYQQDHIWSANTGYYASNQIINPPAFTQDDQKAIDWVCMSKEKWKAYDKKRREDIVKLSIETRERWEGEQKERKANTRIDIYNTIIKPETNNVTKTWWSRWWFV